jgi:hypothetical protein
MSEDNYGNWEIKEGKTINIEVNIIDKNNIIIYDPNIIKLRRNRTGW